MITRMITRVITRMITRMITRAITRILCLVILAKVRVASGVPFLFGMHTLPYQS